MNERKERWLGILVGVLLALALGVFGRMDVEDAEREAAYYCRMVASGAWPDYRHIYDEECEDERKRAKQDRINPF